ncbi:hypothetical protein [Acinetobacter dispersus]|uniref:hypothetical protein n=1 Tax=Acinetobacter dispersus TaxID=70348 RepID=UPI00132EA148|nr:hypothetical protein [Acinetobacter dispersus]QHH96757.1 hypothetical protein FPL17_04055 [Acinetobacter dispersus]
MNSIATKLFNDYAEILKAQLDFSGVKLIHNRTTPEEIVLAYYTWEKKLISQKPRNIYISKEFNCPEHLKIQLDEIKILLMSGSDTSGFLSRNVQKSDKHDFLLYDWGIHHLHFYDYKLSKKRSSELLYIFITDDTVYFLDIKDHSAFEDTDLLEIMYSNWFHLIEPLILKNINGSTHHITEGDRRKLRKHKINTPVVLKDGTAVISMLLGGGITSSGYSSDAADRLMKTQRDISFVGEYLFNAIIEFPVDDVLLCLFTKYSKFNLRVEICTQGYLEFVICDEITGLGATFNSIFERAKLMTSSNQKVS